MPLGPVPDTRGLTLVFESMVDGRDGWFVHRRSTATLSGRRTVMGTSLVRFLTNGVFAGAFVWAGASDAAFGSSCADTSKVGASSDKPTSAARTPPMRISAHP